MTGVWQIVWVNFNKNQVEWRVSYKRLCLRHIELHIEFRCAASTGRCGCSYINRCWQCVATHVWECVCVSRRNMTSRPLTGCCMWWSAAHPRGTSLPSSPTTMWDWTVSTLGNVPWTCECVGTDRCCILSVKVFLHLSDAIISLHPSLPLPHAVIRGKVSASASCR